MTRHFIVAGAQRSGTTLLYQWLDAHPEIEMARPLRPEPKFFLLHDSLDGYRALFRGKPGAHVFGEKSTSYMERGDVAERVRALLPDAQVIFLLRDPVERALSNYRFSVESGVETASLEDALRDEERPYDRARFSVSPFAYLARGHYTRLLEPWERALGRRQLFIMTFEELLHNPASIAPLLQWLGADPSFAPPVPAQAVNATTMDVQASDELRRFLIAQYAESNQQLHERYGVDVSHWQS
jgi:hypothetical protein